MGQKGEILKPGLGFRRFFAEKQLLVQMGE